MFYQHIKTLLTALLLAIPMTAAAQDKAQRKWLAHRPVFIFIEPSAILSGYYNESYRAGFEMPVWKDISFVGTGCYYGDGFGFKTGLKLYIDNDGPAYRKGAFRKAAQRMFIGADYFYKSYSYTDNDVLSSDHDITVNWKVDKRASTVAFFTGELSTFNCGLSYEWFAGLGFRLKTVRNDLEPGESDQFYHWHEGMVTRFTDTEATNQLGLHIALGFKIGWRIR